MNEPRVSVVIVNWNRRDDLKECLQSVFNQTFKNIELIVVDNHSTDGSVEMVRENYPRVNVINLPNSSYGACEAFNIGFANATGQFCIVLDNDAILERNWVTCALQHFSTDAQIGCLAGRVFDYYTKRDWGFEQYGVNITWRDREFFTSTFMGCSAAIRKDVLDKTGGYPQEYFVYWNELALGAKIVNAGFKVKYAPNLIAYHKISQSQRSKPRSYYSVRNGYWYFWTYYPLTLAIKHTFIHFYLTFFLLATDPLAFLKTYAGTLNGLPTIAKKRKPIADKQILRPFKK